MKPVLLILNGMLFAAVFLFSSGPVFAQKSGQSMQIQYGVVVGSEYVKESSDAGKGALIGGAIGLLTGSGKSSGTKFIRTAAGAAIGAGTAAVVQGDRDAREYKVQTTTGITVVISDQTEIQVDDCVVVEIPAKGNANIRQVADTFCEPESAELVADLQEELQEEAAECVAAKQELSSADTDEAVDRALRKISILCDT